MNNEKNIADEKTIKTINSEEKESSNSIGCEKSINLILSPKNNEKIISIDDLKKRYRLSDEINYNSIERKLSDNKKNKTETLRSNKDENNSSYYFTHKELNNQDSDFIQKKILKNWKKSENHLASLNSKNESNQRNTQASIQDKILPTCLKTNSISILSITDKMHVRFKIIKF